MTATVIDVVITGDDDGVTIGGASGVMGPSHSELITAARARSVCSILITTARYAARFPSWLSILVAGCHRSWLSYGCLSSWLFALVAICPRGWLSSWSSLSHHDHMLLHP